MISTLFYPLVTFALVVVVVAFWAATALFLASSGNPIYNVVDNRGVQPSLTGQTCDITVSSYVFVNWDSKIGTASVNFPENSSGRFNGNKKFDPLYLQKNVDSHFDLFKPPDRHLEGDLVLGI